MTEFYINVFNDRTDNKVKPLTATWENIAQLFTSPHEIVEEKSDPKLFNGVRYKTIDDVPKDSDDWMFDIQSDRYYVKRRQANIIETYLLVLDYDGGLSLNEAVNRFKEYEFVYYTSFNHLHDGATEKFRIVFPFTVPIPSWKKFNEFKICTGVGEWYQIIDALKDFAGQCDPNSFNANMIYQMPSVHPSRAHLSRSGHNKGNFLDWRQFKRLTLSEIENNQFDKTANRAELLSKEYLDPDQILQTKHGQVVVKEITGIINGVLCPFHPDKNGTEFVREGLINSLS